MIWNFISENTRENNFLENLAWKIVYFTITAKVKRRFDFGDF